MCVKRVRDAVISDNIIFIASFDPQKFEKSYKA